MMRISSKKWIGIYLIFQIFVLSSIAGIVIYRDPFFHYHGPRDEIFYYSLGNQRNQNNGITRNFDYDMLITGTSMTENFKASEVDEIFHVDSIKVPYAGGSYKEINDNVKVAIGNNKNLKIVVRGLDMSNFYKNKDNMRDDLGEYPIYSNSGNIFDDVKYIYKRDVVFTRCAWMTQNACQGGVAGITSFDKYSYWMPLFIGRFGKDIVLEGHSLYEEPIEIHYLSDEEKEVAKANIKQNVTSIAQENPDIQFYYFFPPYSAAWWGDVYQAGNLRKQIETEQYIIEMLLEYDNIHLFSFNDFTEITTDLNNYKDIAHYGDRVNSTILQYMKDGTGELTKDNYKKYIKKEYNFYATFNYNSLFKR